MKPAAEQEKEPPTRAGRPRWDGVTSARASLGWSVSIPEPLSVRVRRAATLTPSLWSPERKLGAAAHWLDKDRLRSPGLVIVAANIDLGQTTSGAADLNKTASGIRWTGMHLTRCSV